jgi:hypothetical protein
MKGLCALLLSSLILLGGIGHATAQTPTPDAVEIFYDLQDLGSNHYKYTYTVVNKSLATYTYTDSWGDSYTESGVTYFDIYFPIGQDAYFSGFSVTPPNTTQWDVQLYGKANNLPAWAFDAYATPPEGDSNHYEVTYPILVDQSVSGFSVSFDYTGANPLGDQQFTVNRLADLKPIFTGTTELQPYHVPEPSAFLLLAAGMFVVVLRRRNGS